MNERSFNVKACVFSPYYIGQYRTPAPRLSGERGLLALQFAAACRELALPARQVAEICIGKTAECYRLASLCSPHQD